MDDSELQMIQMVPMFFGSMMFSCHLKFKFLHFCISALFFLIIISFASPERIQTAFSQVINTMKCQLPELLYTLGDSSLGRVLSYNTWFLKETITLFFSFFDSDIKDMSKDIFIILDNNNNNNSKKSYKCSSLFLTH